MYHLSLTACGVKPGSWFVVPGSWFSSLNHQSVISNHESTASYRSCFVVIPYLRHLRHLRLKSEEVWSFLNLYLNLYLAASAPSAFVCVSRRLILSSVFIGGSSVRDESPSATSAVRVRIFNFQFPMLWP